MVQEYPDLIQTLGEAVLDSLDETPTAEDVAEDIVVIIEEYHSIIEENRKEIVVESDHFEYDEVSDAIIRDIMLEMIVSTVALDTVEFVIDNLDGKFTKDEVYSHLPNKYIQAETTGEY